MSNALNEVCKPLISRIESIELVRFGSWKNVGVFRQPGSNCLKFYH